MTSEAGSLGPHVLERVLVDAWTVGPGAELIDRGDWVQLTTPGSGQIRGQIRLNGVGLARLSADEADARIEAVKRHYAGHETGFFWIVGPSSTPADLSDRLVRAGVPIFGAALGMSMPVPEQLPELPANLRLEPVGPAQVEDYVDVSVRGWERGPGFAAECRGFLAQLDDNHARSAWVVYEDDVPVGVTVLTELGEIGYLQGATVVPERRGRGIYRAMIHYRLKVLRELGRAHAVVWARESSSAGICERLGFVPSCRAVFHELRR